MRLNHNMASLGIYNNYTKKLRLQSDALKKISTGEKLVSAKDNPNAIGQSELLRIQIRGLDMAQRNLQDTAGMLQTADGGLESITGAIQRIRELSVQVSGTLDDVDKEVIQKEIDAMKEHIDFTAKNTEFNGVKLLWDDRVTDNVDPSYKYSVSGANVGEKVEIPMYNLTSGMLKDAEGNLSLKDIDITKEGGVDEALKITEGALNSVLSMRSKYGAIQNKVESLYDALGETSQSISKAESNLRDSDIVEEMMKYASNGILIEAANAMMAQSNKFPQDILRVLERMR